MKKKYVFWIVIAVIILVVLVCSHYFPLWVSVTGLIAFGAGCVVGWIAKNIYEKYIPKSKE